MGVVLEQKSGHNFIDENHTGLLESIDSLEKDLTDGWHKAVFVTSVDNFISSLENHFLHEETILRGAGYTDLQPHTLKHRDIAMQLRKSALAITDYESAGQFMSLAHSSILGHELIYDQQYWPILEEQPCHDERLIDWNSDLETGNWEIDKHHHALINHINRFHYIYFRAASRSLACQELRHLYAYAKWHFDEEEDELGSAISEGHRAHHETLLNDLKVLMAEVEGGEYQVESISSHLKYWLLNHLRHFDVPAFREAQSGRE
ncbi:MAG: hemerythrin domain-containing protein [Motiliproteus sp.]